MICSSKGALILGLIALAVLIAGLAAGIAYLILHMPDTDSIEMPKLFALPLSTNLRPTWAPSSRPTSVPTSFPTSHPSPKPTFEPTSEAVVDPLNNSSVADAITGYWWWTWGESTSSPPNTTIAIAFSGWSNVTLALRDSVTITPSMSLSTTGNIFKKFLSIGGGNANGHWNKTMINALNDAIASPDQPLSGYDGLAYDIEVLDSGLTQSFQGSFAIAKQYGFQVLISISHSAPYSLSNSNKASEALTMMSTFLHDDVNIDYLSPQLYTTGKESMNDYTSSIGVPWTVYVNAKPKIVPSIVNVTMYSDAKEFFTTALNISIAGFIQWQQV